MNRRSFLSKAPAAIAALTTICTQSASARTIPPDDELIALAKSLDYSKGFDLSYDLTLPILADWMTPEWLSPKQQVYFIYSEKEKRFSISTLAGAVSGILTEDTYVERVKKDINVYTKDNGLWRLSGSDKTFENPVVIDAARNFLTNPSSESKLLHNRGDHVVRPAIARTKNGKNTLVRATVDLSPFDIGMDIFDVYMVEVKEHLHVPYKFIASGTYGFSYSSTGFLIKKPEPYSSR